MAQNEDRVSAVEKLAAERGLPFLRLSAVTGEGVDQLKRMMADSVLAEVK